MELPAVSDWLQRREATWDQAHVHFQQVIRKQKDQADHYRRPNPEYNPSQWVWLSTHDLQLHLPCKNLSPRYMGPFKILRQIMPVSYRLALPSTYLISPTFHVTLLKPVGGLRAEAEEVSDQGPPPIIVEDTYQVQDLLDSRHSLDIGFCL